MKILVTESQLRNLVKRQRDKRKTEKEVEEAASLTSPSTSNQTASSPSTDPSPKSGGSDAGDIGTSMDAKDYPAYPEVGHWESGVTRGPANQIATQSKWSDVVGSKLTRGKANQLK